MKKKGFCFKRTVSLFLAAVMIVTAAPQTSLTALAAEHGMTIETPDVSEGLDILTTEDGTDVSGDIGDGSADVPSDDDAEVGDDEQAGAPDNADEPDDAGDHTDDPDGVNQGDDAGDPDETADPEESMDDDLVTDDESVPGNDLAGGVTVFGDETDEGSGAEPEYKGEIREESFEDGDLAETSYRRLVIDEAAAQEKGEEIAGILTYYAKQIEVGECKKFNCVEFDTDYSSPTMKQENINGARSIMDTDNKQIGYWIDYNFWNETDQATVCYTLSEPEQVEGDIDATLTVERMLHQGVKINAKTTQFPAEYVGVSYNKNEQDAFKECWDNEAKENLRLLAWDDGVTPGVTVPDGMWYDEFEFEEDGETKKGSSFGMDIAGMQAGNDYLITPLYRDSDSVPMGTAKELTAGERSGASDGVGVSDAAWKSLDESLITIDPGEGAAATLAAIDKTGEAYYYVTYTYGGQVWLELHSVQVADEASGGELAYVGEVISDKFEDGDLAETSYRRLLINENDAIEQNGDATIADILKYYEEQIKAGDGNEFNCVELNMNSGSSEPLSYLMKEENINGARSIMDTDNKQIGYWIDYNFWNEADQATVCYTLDKPGQVENDIDATLTVERMPHQGVKINAKTTQFPAEYVGVSYNKNEQDAFKECWDNEDQKPEDLRLLALDDGVTPGVIVPDDMWFDTYGFESEDGVGTGSILRMDIAGIEAGKDYLITPLYVDKDVAKGTKNKLTAGQRSGSPDGAGVTGAAWKSLDEELIVINAGIGVTATLAAIKMGGAYYYVTYECDNKVWLELHSVKVAYAASDGELSYIGEVREDTFEDGDLAGTPYLRLIIDEAAALEQNEDKNITPILKFYKEEGLKVNCVELNIIDESQRKVKKDYINNALSVMDTENDKFDHWIDYNFWNEGTETGVNFTLGAPCETKGDVNATFTLTELANQGLKVKFASTAFPAESVSMSYDQPGIKYADSLPLNEAPFRLFTHSSGTPKAMVDTNEEQGWGYYSTDENGTHVHFNNIKPLGATEYLAASIYEDEERPEVGGNPVQLKAGTRAGVSASSATSVTWKLFDANKATIDANGKLTAWSDRDAIYYYVTYKVGSAQYLEVHEMWAKSQPVNIYFDEPKITVEMNTDPAPEAEPARKFLRLRFKPSDAERDTHNPNEILWEIIENGNAGEPVIDFVYYDDDWNEVKRDENGNLPKGAAPNGEIKALREGTATVQVSYLDVEEGEEIPTATCTVKVVRPLWDDVDEAVSNSNLYAVMDLDTKLSDIALDQQLGEGWEWEYPDTLLANFKGMDGSRFPAVYTAEDGRTVSAAPWVRFVTVTGIEIGSKNENQAENNEPYDGWVPDSIGKGEKVTLGYSYRMDCLDGDEETWQAEYDAVKARMGEKYQIEWTSNPAAAVGKGETYQFTAPSITSAQKYTFTVSVKDKTTNSVYLKNSCAITVTVTDNPEFEWDKIDSFYTDIDQDGKTFFHIKIRDMNKDDYKKQPLTIVSEDTAILKLKGRLLEPDEVTYDDGTKCTILTIQCDKPKPGTAWIKMTAADEIRSSRRFCHEFIDKAPKLNVSAVTINQALEDRSAVVTVRTHQQYPLDESRVTLQLNGKSTTDITAYVSSSAVVGGGEDENDGYCDYNIKLNLKESTRSVKKGKNKVALKVVVTPADGTDEKPYSLNLTVNVTKTVPKVTFKQTKKVNLFYTNEERNGILKANVTGANIKNLELTGCGYEVIWDEESGVYRIALKEGGNKNSKKGKLNYEIEGCSGTFKKNFTVSTQNKKPTIVLSQKSDTLYPKAGYATSWLSMSDKATGEVIIPSEVRYVDKKNKINYSLTIERGDVDWEDHAGEWNITKKTDYNLLATTWGGIAFLLQDKDNYKKKTDKFSLEIKEDNWTKAVAISYSIKVDTAKPKLVLGKSTLTLNKNNAVYRAQQQRTSLHLKGTSDAVYQDEWNWVTFEGKDEKSRKILRKDNSLVLRYRDDQGDVIVFFNDNSMDTGTYNFTVSVGNNGNGLKASADLTVKIVDTPIASTLNVTAKGSIDVMNREGTSITYTPKISDLSGKVVDGRLEGIDSDLFENWWDGSKLIVKARGGETYSTKHTYRVRAVFDVETEDYDNLTVSTNPQSIKVKQKSKPKLKASTAGNTIYRQFDNTVDIKLSAMLNKREVEIKDAWLINYTDDFELRRTPASWTDDDGTVNEWDAIYNPGTKSVRLGLIDRYNAKNVIKSGKTWKVKLAVQYCDQAGNEKAAQVTCSIVVR